jgi:hypothetical protein
MARRSFAAKVKGFEEFRKLPVQKCWAMLFSQQAKERRTDAQLIEIMESLFPGRDNRAFRRVVMIRSLYNAGTLGKGKGHIKAPKQPVPAYDAKGKPYLPQRGRPTAKGARRTRPAGDAPAKRQGALKVKPKSGGLRIKRAASAARSVPKLRDE